jgi:rSAM/selenodomain-associated transferase 2/rSAM/selenodomain-associated transferase 1
MDTQPFVSVIIPTWRDEVELAGALRSATCSGQVEVIIACALGEERRYDVLREYHPDAILVSAPRGRGTQMNAGAAVARGRWLLFLHADSELSPIWLAVLQQLNRNADFAGGAFRLRIQSDAWQARVIERGVRLRVALFGLPYGDQGLFVRRQVFNELGGYRDLPLMEDVDFVRRMRWHGRLLYSRASVLTSARRWEHDGWFRRSAQNVWLATQFLAGVAPARLARKYLRRKSAAIVIMTRAPWMPGKTRLTVAASDHAHAMLRRALFLDTLDAVRAVPGVDLIIACEPARACEEMRDLVGPTVDVIAQRGDELGERMIHALQDVFRLGHDNVVLVGSDLPDLPPRLVEAAVSKLQARTKDIVLGPAIDGGYYLIGMNRPFSSMFKAIDWSSDRVLDQTLAAAAAQGLVVDQLDPWPDVDTPADLDRLMGHPGESAARRTRVWADDHLRSR